MPVILSRNADDLGAGAPILRTLRENVSVEDINNACRELQQLNESWNNRPSLDGRFRREHYLDGRIEIVVLVRLVRPISGIGPGNEYRMVIWPYDSNSSGPELEPQIVRADEERSIDFGPHRNDRPVFVHVVQLVNDPKGFASALVGLEELNESSDFLTGTIYFSINGIDKFFPFFHNWEAGRRSRLTTVHSDGFANNVVKCGSEIVNAISEHHAPLDGDLSPKTVIESLRITLTDEKIAVSVSEALQRRVEIMDVLFGPFDLSFGS